MIRMHDEHTYYCATCQPFERACVCGERHVASRSGCLMDPHDETSYDQVLAAAADWLFQLRETGIDLTKTAHLKTPHEAAEFAEDPTPEEAADVIITIVGAAIHHGWSKRDLTEAIARKVTVNSRRTWVRQADGTFQHLPSVLPGYAPCDECESTGRNCAAHRTPPATVDTRALKIQAVRQSVYQVDMADDERRAQIADELTTLNQEMGLI